MAIYIGIFCFWEENLILHQVKSAFLFLIAIFKQHPYDVAIGNKHVCTELILKIFSKRTNLELEIRICDILC